MAHDSAVVEFFHEWTDLAEWVDWLGEWNISRNLILSTLSFGLLTVLSQQIPNFTLFAFEWLIGTAPVWLPIALAVGAWHVWVWYIQSLYLSKRDVVLLEMKVPREVTKSPRAMELALTSFSLSSGETTVYHRAWKGQVRPIFSFEIASFGGEIHFYVWCWRNYKDTVEGALYAQYPEIELHEVEDYASKFRYDSNIHNGWGMEWPLQTYMGGFEGGGTKDFRINAYQPRSYIDFELEKDPKEEFKIDPLANVLEFMGNIKPTEQMWIQIIMRKSGKLTVFKGKPDEDTEWKKMVEIEVNRIRTQAAIIPQDVLTAELEEAGEDAERHVSVRPSWKQNEMMRSMERHLGKYPFQVGMRGIYWAEGELRGPMYTGMRWIWRPFGNPQYGSHLRPRRWHCDFDYPWADFRGIRWDLMLRRVHDAYRRRSFFHAPWEGDTIILTNETIASLWHPPSRSITVPGLERISATKVEPPSNLPK